MAKSRPKGVKHTVKTVPAVDPDYAFEIDDIEGLADALAGGGGGVGPQGPEGPQGPAGNDGAQGLQGIQGPAGNDGADGTGVVVVAALPGSPDPNTLYVVTG